MSWRNAKRYKLGRVEILVIRAKKFEPVKWYTEAIVNDGYFASYGSNSEYRLWAVAEAYIKTQFVRFR